MKVGACSRWMVGLWCGCLARRLPVLVRAKRRSLFRGHENKVHWPVKLRPLLRQPHCPSKKIERKTHRPFRGVAWLRPKRKIRLHPRRLRLLVSSVNRADLCARLPPKRRGRKT